ncbi:MAG: hypothetical protein WCP86_08265, partial [bacterium]
MLNRLLFRLLALLLPLNALSIPTPVSLEPVVEQYGYLANGQLCYVTNALGVGRAYSYDNGGALVRVDWSNAPSTFFQDLDLMGRPLVVAHGGITNRYTYLLDGAVATVDNSGVSIPASSMSYGYD